MLRIIYTLAITLLFPIVLLYFWWRGRKVPGYRQRITERFGLFKALTTTRQVVWIHAVSVGEVFAAKQLIQHFLKDSRLSVVVTTITPTGSDRVLEDFGSRVFHVYAPFDLPIFVTQFLNRIQPNIAIIIETELWPNILRACDKKHIPAVVANARLSEKSARGYRRFKGIAKALFNQTTIIAAQNRIDGQRFLDLGLHPSKLEITGSIKFDITVHAELRQTAKNTRKQLLGRHTARKVLIAASTHPGEEEFILEGFKRLLKQHPNTLLILVPRHPDHFDRVYDLALKYRLATQRRTQVQEVHEQTHVLIGDTMGELMLLYGCSDIAFIGGSLIERGGHNMIEAAAWGLPCLSGPYVFNFADISERLIESGGMHLVDSADSLCEAWDHWLCHPDELEKAGEAGAHFVLDNQGALERLLNIIYQRLNLPLASEEPQRDPVKVSSANHAPL